MHDYCRLLLVTLFSQTVIVSTAQTSKTSSNADSLKVKFATNGPSFSTKGSLKGYKEIITDKAETSFGMFKVHKVEEKYFFEIPDSLLNRDILTVARIARGAVGVRAGFSGYAGDEIGENVIRFEKGPNNKLFVKNVIFQETSRDSLNGMYWNVVNSNMAPIALSFDIKATSPDSSASVIDVTDLISGDNEILYFDGGSKRVLGIGGMQPDKSYITRVKAFPENIEIRSVKTYGRMQGSGNGSSGASTATFELNVSLVLLPKQPMRSRYYDDRIGFLTTEIISDFDLNPQGVERIRFIRRFRLEPKPEDIDKYNRGELVEPQKPIVFYIDPTTPKKWVPFLIEGINDWRAAFEQAGFKNAITGKIAPVVSDDSTWSIDDARHNAIIYKPSDVANASGPSIIDPRSGEILEAHINWYHNIMNLLRNWYFVQTAATDPRARKMTLDDELMGQLIRFAVSHEVGHTLGLQHNFGASSTIPVEKLRDKNFLATFSFTPSIMDYARFNYVAQPEDGIPATGLLPKIGEYDKWAISWGYHYYTWFKNADAEKQYLSQLTSDSLTANKRLFYGDGESNRDDPRNQVEDLGDNAMKASGYGIKNLQRIVEKLPEWATEPGKDYTNLRDLYSQVTLQFSRYCTHVSSNIGGIERTPKRMGEPGAIFEYTSRQKQKDAMLWLQASLFKTPTWLVSRKITRFTNQNPQAVISSIQDRTLNYLLSAQTSVKLLRFEMDEAKISYTLSGMIDDLRKGIFSELATHTPVDMYRRTLQKSLTEKLIGMTDNSQAGAIVFSIGSGTTFISQGISRTSDAISIVKASLNKLQLQIKAAIPLYTDQATKNHLSDLNSRIEEAFHPKNQ
jgi:hypothetical protein